MGIRELGGSVMFLAADDIQLGRGEPIEDTARVMGRMLHGAVIRTFAQSDVEIFAQSSGIPTINALTDEEHPCQILSDLFTLSESRKNLHGLKLAFVGDGDCNVARSWVWAAAKLGFELRIAAPEKFLPPPSLIGEAQGNIRLYSQRDVERLRQIQRLVNDLGLNLAGVDIILRLSERIAALEAENRELRGELQRFRDRRLPAPVGRGSTE